MTDLIALAERVEAAAANEQREMLIEAWNAVHPGSHVAWDGTAIAPYRAGFLRFIEAEAWTDAAMTLAGDDPDFDLSREHDGRWLCTIGAVGERATKGYATAATATPALALTAACLRAHATKDTDSHG